MRFNEALRRRWRSIAIAGTGALLASCAGTFETEPLVEYSTDINVQGDAPQTFTRQLRAGVYLVEVRERDIDLRVGIDGSQGHTDLADAYLRHGLHRTVVSFDAPATLKIGRASCRERV